ncbi:TetR family transcriptional regulator [Paenibacillus sp. M1]|uniref:TetR family transcriptional regulator n=1 Tax=Paenibacillus haidiansis TaxID=1574488 RepID=A0ABU7VQA6_9BACL
MSLKTYSRKEKVVLEAALQLMFLNGYEAVTTQAVAERLAISQVYLEEMYPACDELQMSAMTYAAVVWVKKTKEELAKIADPEQRFRRLVRLYAEGTGNYPESLSLYLDAWKLLRDRRRNVELIRSVLFEIYDLYVGLFIKTVEQIGTIQADKQLVETIAWIFVVISDGFHIQSLIQNRLPDFDKISDVLFLLTGGLGKEGIDEKCLSVLPKN